MQIDVYKKVQKKNSILTGYSKEFLFKIESNNVPQIGEFFIDEQNQKYEVISVIRLISNKKDNTFYNESYIVEVVEKEAFDNITIKGPIVEHIPFLMNKE